MASQAEIDLIVNATNTLSQLDADLRRIVALAEARAPSIDIDVDVDQGALSRITSAASGAVRALAPLAAAGVAVGAAAPLIGGVVLALQNIAPAATVGVAAMGAVVLTTTTLKLAMAGVGEAIETAFDPEATTEEFNESLKRLAPEAQKFVKELRSMREPLAELRKGVQDRVFKDFDEALSAVAKSTLPTLRGALNRTADSLNAMGLEIAKSAIQLSESGTLGKATEGATQSLERLEKVPGQIVVSLGILAAAGAPHLERLAAKVADVAERISQDLVAAFEDGSLDSAVNNAIDVIKQLGRIAGNIFGGLNNIIGGVTEEAGSLFFIIEEISGQFESFTASDSFQDALTELVKVAGELASQALPLIGDALRILGGVVEIIGPPIRRLLEELGPKFRDVLTALEPVLLKAAEVLGKLEEPLGILLGLALDIIEQALPVLTPAFEELGRVIEELTPFIKEFADNLLEQLKPVLAELPGILEELLPKLTELAVQLLPLLIQFLQEVGPELAELAKQLAEAAVQATPLISKVLDLTIRLVNDLLPALTAVVEFITISVIGIMRTFSFVLENIVQPALRTIEAILKGDFSAAFDAALSAIVRMTGLSTESFQRLKDSFSRLAGEAATAVVQKMIQLRDGSVRVIQQAIRLITDPWGQLGNLIRSAVGNLGGLLEGVGSDIVAGLIRGMASQLARLRGIAEEIASTVAGAVKDLLLISSPSKLFIQIGEDTVEGAVIGIRNMLPELRNTATDIGTAIAGFGSQDPFSTAGFRVPTQAAPVVQVFIDGERFNDRIDTRALDQIDANSRLLARGIRR